MICSAAATIVRIASGRVSLGSGCRPQRRQR